MSSMRIHCRADIPYVGFDRAELVPTDIIDGRYEPTVWTDAGFELRTFASAVTDWTDDDDVIDRHHPEMTALVTAELGCDAVIFYPALVRSPEQAAASGKDHGPIEAAHSDYSEDYRTMMATPGHPYVDLLRPSMDAAGVSVADLAGARRIVTIQMWRNIGARRPDRPLAFCDTRTVDRHELVPHLVEDYAGVPARFESLLMTRPTGPDRRRWYTFPDMTPDEVVFFRAFDSELAASGGRFWTPHTAFVDPTAGPDAAPRRSVETRAICLFFDPAPDA